MNKLLIICGPTATGKTSLALSLAHRFKGELISADSRQVYKGLDIGTGKDLPPSASKHPSGLKFNHSSLDYFLVNQIRLWGYDLVNPDEEFSLAHFQKISQKIITDIFKRNRNPILVGGTGLYLKSFEEPLSDISIPPQEKLRQSLNGRVVTELQQILKEINPSRLSQMNSSDSKNPRRLIRAIEIILSVGKNRQSSENDYPHKYKTLIIGLTAPLSELHHRIDQRIEQRLISGVENEVANLYKRGYDFQLPAFSAFGYREWAEHFISNLPREEVIQRWKKAELAYVKRQLTWFRKNKSIRWFDISARNFENRVVSLVGQWYSKT